MALLKLHVADARLVSREFGEPDHLVLNRHRAGLPFLLEAILGVLYNEGILAKRNGGYHSAEQAGVAQLVEQRFCKARVGGSSPLTGFSPIEVRLRLRRSHDDFDRKDLEPA
jgi:hypothetical protein